MRFARRNAEFTARLLSIGLLCLLVFSVSGLLAGSAAAEDHESTAPETVVEGGSPDPASDQLGWEDGIWANATLSIDQSDGINRTERDALVARTMARVESVRGLEFDRAPPVRILFQRELQAEFETASVIPETSNASRIVLNQQYEALFLINESRDAVDSRRTLYGTATNGLYDPETGNVTMVSPNATVRQLREGVLAQELFHALQDSRFDLPAVETIEQRNTRNSYVEGDANYVQDLYEQRCEGAWDGTCYLLDRETIPDLSGLNDGMERLFRQPYQSGYAFVQDRHQRSGWEAVNRLYERPPASTAQVIHPETNGRDEPASLRIDDQSADSWEPLTVDGERVTESVGEPGLFVSLLYPALQTVGESQIIPFDAQFAEERRVGSQDELGGQIYSYAHPLTAGWNGDRLLPYVTANGTQRGYVYETAWDSPADAREFHEGYRKLLAYHGADAVGDRANTYRLPDDSGFADALFINRTGSRLRIVNGPSVESLSAIRRGAAPEVNGTQRALPWERVRPKWYVTVQDDSLVSLTVRNGTAYAQDTAGTLYAIDGGTGDRLWTHRFNTSLVSPPTASGDSLYVGTGTQRLVAIDAETGDEQWTQQVGGPVIEAPTVRDEIVYAAEARGDLFALNRTTGTTIWAEPLRNVTTSRVIVHDDTAIVPRGTNLSAVDVQTGESVWEVDAGGVVLPGLSSSNGTAFATSIEPAQRVTAVHAVDLTAGEIEWTREIPDAGQVRQTAVNDTVYVSAVDTRSGRADSSSRTGRVLALERESGQSRWRLDVEGAPRTPLVSERTVYTGTSTGQLHAIEAASGRYEWNYSTDQSVTDPLAVDNRTLYVGTQNGVVSAVNATTGEQRWMYIADGLTTVSPAVDSGSVYVEGLSTLTAVTDLSNSTEDPATSPPSAGQRSDDKNSTDATNSADDSGNRSTDPTGDETGAGFGIVAAGVGLLILLAGGRRMQ